MIDQTDLQIKRSVIVSQIETVNLNYDDLGLEQLAHFPPIDSNTLDLILTSLSSQFQNIYPMDKLNDHDAIAGTLNVTIPLLFSL